MEKETSLLFRLSWTLALIGGLISGAYSAGATREKESLTNQRNHLKSIEDSLLIDSIQIREVGLPLQNNLDNYVPQHKSQESKTQVNERINYRTTNLQTDPIDLLLARLIYGEARSCSKEERGEVGETPLTRSGFLENKDEERLRKIMLKNKNVKGKLVWQYSCFGDHNREKLMNPTEIKAFEECLGIAREILANKSLNSKNRADHYHTKDTKPPWAKKMIPLPLFDANQSHTFYDSKRK